MSYNFCTLFDKNFLYKGLALHESLLENCDDFHLWILCMDEITYKTLNLVKPEKTTLISLSEIESVDLLNIKKTRSYVEYLWTLSSNLCWFILSNKPALESIAYLDADLYFFSSPKKIYEEIEKDSIGIIPHRLGDDRKPKEQSVGKYNVGMVIFKNDESGKACLEWWKDRCNEWCYNRLENDRFGDQKYLDYFSELFGGVRVIENKGADLAPWNIGRFAVSLKNRKVLIDDDELIFFHFSSFKIYPHNRLLTFGPITPYLYTNWSKAKLYIYKPYAKSLYRAIEKVGKIDASFNYGLTQRPTKHKQQLYEFYINSLESPLRYILKPVKNLIKKILQ